MNLHEYQSKELFRSYGIPVPNGKAAFSASEAVEAAKSLKGDKYIVKAQVHAGGRGKAGGVKIVDSVEQAGEVAGSMLGTNLVTFQTDANGQPVNRILVEEICDIANELYLGAVLDRSRCRMVIMASTECGVEIVKDQGQPLNGLKIFAVGLGTAGRLRELGVAEVEVPSSEFSSEGLLRLDGLAEAQVTDQRILIFRGTEGREYLAKTLERRGAEVVYCECYERRKPEIVLVDTLKDNDVKVPDIGLATSIEALDNLADKIEDEGLDHLFDMQMLVVSSRVGQEVESLGFTNPPLVVETK